MDALTRCVPGFPLQVGNPVREAIALDGGGIAGGIEASIGVILKDHPDACSRRASESTCYKDMEE
jgi:hypothetical protein